MSYTDTTSGSAADLDDRPPMAAGPAAALHRVGLCGTHLRGRLVSTASAVGRFLGGLARDPARHFHGRHVPRQLPAAAIHQPSLSSASCLRHLELGIGAFGLIVLWVVPLIGGFYTTIAGTGQASLFLRAIVAGICLLPPTILMGATLPAIARWVKATPSWSGVARLLLRRETSRGPSSAVSSPASICCACTTCRPRPYVAVTLNVLVAVLGFAIARVTVLRAGRREAPSVAPSPESRLIYVAIALSGLTALGAEVVWTRILSLLFGATTYTFSLILAVFLVGLGIGSTLGADMRGVVPSPRMALGWCQLLLCGTIAWAGYAAGASLPYWPINPSISTNPTYNFQLDLMRVDLGAASPRRCSGAQASRWRSVRSRVTRRIRDGSWAACTPPTPSARLSGRSSPVSCCSARSAVR